VIRLLLACLLLLPTIAQALTLEGVATQGGLMIGRAAPGAIVSLDGQKVATTPGGDFVLGFGRDAKPVAQLVVRYKGGKRETRTIAVAARKYKIQRIDGLPKRKVEPKKRDMTRIIAERDLFRTVRARLTPQSWFRSGFVWPVTGRISGVWQPAHPQRPAAQPASRHRYRSKNRDEGGGRRRRRGGARP
jgi:hypothetical protein